MRAQRLTVLLILVLSLTGPAAAPAGKGGNRLIHADSPYLLLHARNPVDWYPWGEEAFARARKENKPIFLSIGYSTCHWCHVMARESFENPEIAGLINRYFIPVKVDREARPDIDAVYMAATQLINGHGGWPMTVFLDHRLRPFHAGTYYPPYSSDGVTGLKTLLLKVQQLWQKDRALLEAHAERVSRQIGQYADDTAAPEKLPPDIHERALAEIESLFDTDHGGFSAAPKFPRPGIFAFLNRLAASDRQKYQSALNMLQTTLDAMAAGGIFDQAGGGFHRYAVDAQWQVPHFEKMLYTQAFMVMAYSDLYRLVEKPAYRRVVIQTLGFVSREMRSPEGGYYSALDADSERPDGSGEHGEGAYYLWSESELKEHLAADEFAFVRAYFHILPQGNIFSDPNGEFEGLNILAVDEDFRDEALTQKQLALLAGVREKLMRLRQQRPRPQRDDKVITAWNAMMITALARAAGVFNKPEWLQQAKSGLRFIDARLHDGNTGRLRRYYRNRAVQSGGHLADYAWLVHALLEVYQASGEARWLRQAQAWQQRQDRLFLDDDSGAYYESDSQDASLLFRFKSIYDEALPAGNAIALANLRRLARLSGKTEEGRRWSRQADRLLRGFAAAVKRYPSGAAMLLSVEAPAAPASP